MFTYENFRSIVKELDSVESVTGKKYKEINVQGDFMSFRRENSEKLETISMMEMYRFMCEQSIENITTSNAKFHITGRVQSPAVAVIRKVYEKDMLIMKSRRNTKR